MKTNKDHFQFNDFLDYIEDKLDPELRIQIEDHLVAGCLECQAELKTAKRLLVSLQAASWPRPSRKSRKAVLKAFRRVPGKTIAARTWYRPALAGGLALAVIVAVLFLVFPKKAAAATLVNIRGTVSVIDHTSGIELTSREGSQIYPGNEIRTGSDASAILKLPDGSEVQLGYSAVIYLNQLEKTGDHWSISLFQETGFTRHLVDSRNTKYSLETEFGQVVVTGTEFSVEILDEGGVQVVVVEGLVEIDTGNNSIKLDPGMTVQYFPEGNIELMIPGTDPASSGDPEVSVTPEPKGAEPENSNETSQPAESSEPEETESPDNEPTGSAEETSAPEEKPETESD